MITEVPIFMKIDGALSFDETSKILERHLQTTSLPEIMVSPAAVIDSEEISFAAAFNLKGENADEIKASAEKILSLGIGRFEFASIKFCGQGIHCCFAVVPEKIDDIALTLHGYFSSSDENICTCGIMKRSASLCYVICFLKPQILENKSEEEQSHLIQTWKDSMDYILDYLDCQTKDYLLVGYQKF